VAVGRAKRHLFDDFAFVGVQECYPESLALLAATIPWVVAAGNGLEVVHANKKQGQAKQQQQQQQGLQQPERGHGSGDRGADGGALDAETEAAI